MAALDFDGLTLRVGTEWERAAEETARQRAEADHG